LEGDFDANYAHYCLHKLKKFPHELTRLDVYEKAFVVASIQIKTENEEKENKRIKARRSKKR